MPFWNLMTIPFYQALVAEVKSRWGIILVSNTLFLISFYKKNIQKKADKQDLVEPEILSKKIKMN